MRQNIAADPTLAATAEVAATTLSRRDRRRQRKAARGDGGETDDGDGETDGTRPTSRSRLLKAVIAFVVLALLVAAFVATAAWARRGYFVDFNNSDDVVIYQGKPDGFLWFEPTAETAGNPSREDLDEESADLVSARPTFSSFDDAESFIRELDLVEPPTDADTTDEESDGERPSDTSDDTTPEPGTTEAS